MEFTGKMMEVVQAKNASLVGISGRVQEETLHSFILKTAHGLKRVLKKDASFKVCIDGKNIVVDGSVLEKRPEDRIR
ncbi:MAG: ribonuclease P protein subunit [Nanoarchaeota archaeon]